LVTHFCQSGLLVSSWTRTGAGGKHTFWDGGVRVVSFISGGLIPVPRRGVVFAGLAHSSDWYLPTPHNQEAIRNLQSGPDSASICGVLYILVLVGRSRYATFVVGVARGTLPAHTGSLPPDSVNIWQAVLTGGASPRTEVIHQVQNSHFTEQTTAIQVGDMKLIRGGSVGDDRILAWPKPGDASPTTHKPSPQATSHKQ
jgi:hypothetical protein